MARASLLLGAVSQVSQLKKKSTEKRPVFVEANRSGSQKLYLKQKHCCLTNLLRIHLKPQADILSVRYYRGHDTKHIEWCTGHVTRLSWFPLIIITSVTGSDLKPPPMSNDSTPLPLATCEDVANSRQPGFDTERLTSWCGQYDSDHLCDSTNGESHSKLVSSWTLDLLRNMFLSTCGPENELPHSPGYPQYGEYVHGVHAQKATKASSDESCEWDENGWEDCYDPRKKIEDDYKCIYTVWFLWSSRAKRLSALVRDQEHNPSKERPNAKVAFDVHALVQEDRSGSRCSYTSKSSNTRTAKPPDIESGTQHPHKRCRQLQSPSVKLRRDAAVVWRAG
ncbi:hypothetical protein PAXINDRAFT_156867 [Paxillus involutus ATCC 200175]|uniref:Uncharacterized protein n=1 Tax=Paxillus involutus ATCC 200175 TaxID=664439 RepID=A0A0C9TAL1_PAXIN|nr:hypothetical protein PAXINDRAFT_156867 [Paxillus involutus ATCC 200175]